MKTQINLSSSFIFSSDATVSPYMVGLLRELEAEFIVVLTRTPEIFAKVVVESLQILKDAGFTVSYNRAVSPFITEGRAVIAEAVQVNEEAAEFEYARMIEM